MGIDWQPIDTLPDVFEQRVLVFQDNKRFSSDPAGKLVFCLERKPNDREDFWDLASGISGGLMNFEPTHWAYVNLPE